MQDLVLVVDLNNVWHIGSATYVNLYQPQQRMVPICHILQARVQVCRELALDRQHRAPNATLAASTSHAGHLGLRTGFGSRGSGVCGLGRRHGWEFRAQTPSRRVLASPSPRTLFLANLP